MKLLYTAKVDSKKSECLICGKHGIAGVIVTFAPAHAGVNLAETNARNPGSRRDQSNQNQINASNETFFYCSPCISLLTEANKGKR